MFSSLRDLKTFTIDLLFYRTPEICSILCVLPFSFVDYNRFSLAK